MQHPKYNIYDTPGEVAEQFAFELIKIWDKNKDNEYHISLSGGSTPKLLFKRLGEIFIDGFPYPNVHFWWGDERCVPANDPESNFGVVNELFFSKAKVADYQIHRIKGENDPKVEAVSYAQQICDMLPSKNDIPVYDLIVLGMGNDGHTASIFPHQSEFLTSEKVCEVATHPETKQKRVTITGQIIKNARQVVFLATGLSKAKLIGQLYHNVKVENKEPFRYFGEDENTFWFIDQEAAGEM